jgi:hypothetical protein
MTGVEGMRVSFFGPLERVVWGVVTNAYDKWSFRAYVERQDDVAEHLLVVGHSESRDVAQKSVECAMEAYFNGYREAYVDG